MRLRSVVQFTLASGLLGLAAPVRADLVWDSITQEVTVKSSDLMANTSAGSPTPASSVHFKFTNTGPGAVTLTEAKPDCSCVVAPLEKGTFSAGEGGEIVATYTPQSSPASGALIPPMATVPIHVRFVDEGGKSRTTLLLLKTRIVDVVKCSEGFVYWKPGDALEKRVVKLEVSPGEPLTLERVTSQVPAYTVELRRLQNSDAYEVEITPPKDRMRGASDLLIFGRGPDGILKPVQRIVARIF
jgi:hypothetical protein